ncbi:choice-of-anchor Q domain-containing protein [Salinimicrobium sp. HB62]|uniref:choice-of-anchor Q domain-containing protein n=1 Tax=Salinimicrobium sp. HB62 TaxID=3077781 RepID=UPI002D768E12|nr:choice-of-anchor Q domain-containing protein [Salinimicrobium sp. HB62]
MKNITALILLLLLVFWSSCRSDFESSETNGQLEFSKDTVFLDTVFSSLSTQTYSLKVYNRSGEDIFIPQVSLKNGENSLYRLNVDGVAGNTFEDVEILAKDSIYIFIETTVPKDAGEGNEFLYTDKLQFRSQSHLQEVPLVTLVKDATFLYPKKDSRGVPEKISIGTNENGEPVMVTGFQLNGDQLNFTGDKPYVIYGYAAVPEGAILHIEAGARIHFHADSGILVLKDASLQVKGMASTDPEKMENEVIFQGDRLQGLYRNIPGQWGAIWLQKYSKDHLFEHVTIRNAGVGLLAEGTALSPTSVNLKNVQIYNSAHSGIRAENAEITAENLVINNSGQASLHINGGNYLFRHLSLGNYWQQSYRQAPALFVRNFSEEEPSPLKAVFQNSIIYGNENRELGFDLDESVPVELQFSYSLLKFSGEQEPEGFYDFSNNEIYYNIWLNEDPLFVAPKENDLRLRENSPAIDKGDAGVAQKVLRDILGRDRIPNPDLGAYEFVGIEE